MRIYALIMTCLMALSTTAYAAENTPPPTDIAKPTASVTEDYVCPMHDKVHGKKDGICPICGMHLIPAPVNPAASTEADGKR